MTVVLPLLTPFLLVVVLAIVVFMVYNNGGRDFAIRLLAEEIEKIYNELDEVKKEKELGS